MKKIIVCRNKSHKKRKDWHYSLDRSDLDDGCESCHFIRTHQGESCYEDWAHCVCPIKMKYGDKIEITPAVAAKYKLIGSKKPDFDI